MADTAFVVGQRVMVTDKYRGAGCNHDMIGYYGHVAYFDGEYTHVSLQGRAGQPVDPSRQEYIGGRPFPFYDFELEHAD